MHQKTFPSTPEQEHLAFVGQRQPLEASVILGVGGSSKSMKG